MCLGMDRRVAAALVDIDFVARYQELSRRFGGEREDSSGRLERFDNERVFAIFARLGWDAKYFKGERFFRSISREYDGYPLYCNVCLQYGLAELVWVVLRGK